MTENTLFPARFGPTTVTVHYETYVHGNYLGRIHILFTLISDVPAPKKAGLEGPDKVGASQNHHLQSTGNGAQA